MKIQEVVSWNVIFVIVETLLSTDVTHAATFFVSFAPKHISEDVTQGHTVWCHLRKPKIWEL